MISRSKIAQLQRKKDESAAMMQETTRELDLAIREYFLARWEEGYDGSDARLCEEVRDVVNMSMSKIKINLYTAKLFKDVAKGGKLKLN